ncbi:MAG: hypothetical protein ACREMD_10180 [Gemmatimonadota bacterium]
MTFRPKFGRYYKGSEFNKIVTEASASISSGVECEVPGASSCGGFSWFDGFKNPGQGTPNLWNGVWWVRLTVSPIPPATTTQRCSVAMAHNHIDTGGANGTFFDLFAGDQKVEFNVASSGSCSGSVLPAGPSDPVQPIASTKLEALFQTGTPATFTGFVGDSFSLTAAPKGGRSSYKFAWKTIPNAEVEVFTTDFSGVEFNTQSTKTVTFSQAGTFWLRYLLRDGNDVKSQGGNYAVSGVCRFDITTRPALGAKWVSHTLPGTATQYTWYATSVTLKNVGTETWTGTAFGLFQMPSQYWSPTSVAYGSGSTATNQTKSYYFNVGMMSAHTGWQNNYWKMKKSGVSFGDSIGTRSFVKVGSEPPPAASRAVEWLLARLSPESVQAAVASWRSFPQAEVVHAVEARDFPLPVEEIETTGQFLLRYEASLVDPWDVDFHMAVDYDPAIFEPGKVKPGVRGGSHRIELEAVAPGRVVVHGTRVGNGKLNGEGLIFEIPLQLVEGAAVPQTFPRVELTATR